jgi:hypothetical protein
MPLPANSLIQSARHVTAYIHIPWYTECPRRKGPNSGRLFLRSNYTDITQNTYIQSRMVRDNGQRSLNFWQLLLTYWLPNTWNWQEYVVSVMLLSVLNIKVTCEWHKAIIQTSKTSRSRVIIAHWFPTIIAYEHLFRSQGRCRLPVAIRLECNWSSGGPSHSPARVQTLVVGFAFNFTIKIVWIKHFDVWLTFM